MSYPSDYSPITFALKELIYKFNLIDDSTSKVLLTAGSTESLRLIFDVLLNDGDSVLYPIPSYSNALNLLKLRTHNITSIIHEDIFDIDEHLKNFQYKLVYLTSPNNPMGFFFDSTQLEYLVKKYSQTFFVIDCCYLEYCNNYSLYNINSHNLIIVRTFSKAFGLAGLRIGYLYSSTDTVKKLNVLRDPHLPMELSKYVAYIALQNIQKYEYIWSNFRETREWMLNELAKLNFHVNNNSKGMFVTAKVSVGNNIELCDFVKNKHNILIKPLMGECFGLEDGTYIRIGMGRRDKMEKLLMAINDFYEIKKHIETTR